MPNYSIDKYSLQIECGPTAGGRRALFFLHSGTTLRGWITFYDDGAALPNPSLDTNNRITLPMPLGRFASVMDVLRNEKPVTLYYNSPTFAGFSIGGEPVGEEET